MRKFLPFIFSMGLLIASISVNAQYSVKIIKTGTDGGVDVSYDDGEYENDAIDKLYDDDLDMGWEGDDLNIMTTFLRFQHVYIPQGATIDSAFIRIYAHEDEQDTAKITVFAEDADNSQAFSDTELITDRNWTSDSIKWVIGEPWTMWQPYQSIDVSSVIQAVINRSGWVSGNALTLFFRGENQGASLLDNARDFESFENIEDPADGGDGLHHPERVPELILYGTFVGMEENNAAQNELNIYPNPSINGLFTLQMDNRQKTEVKVFDLSGKMVRNMQVQQSVQQIDLSDLQNGIYFVQATNNEKTYSAKIVINK
jgi:hypothetical protein